MQCKKKILGSIKFLKKSPALDSNLFILFSQEVVTMVSKADVAMYVNISMSDCND